MTPCGAKTSAGTPCRCAAMPNGRCYRHGGASTGRPIETGRYSLTHRTALAAKVRTFLGDQRPGDLTDELALMRALLQDYLERYPDGSDLTIMEIGHLMSMVETISRLVERIARILNQNALTVAEVQLLQARLADVLIRYVDDPDTRLAILDELAAVIGADRRGTATGPKLSAAD
jgi:hypothetical protein